MRKSQKRGTPETSAASVAPSGSDADDDPVRKLNQLPVFKRKKSASAKEGL